MVSFKIREFVKLTAVMLIMLGAEIAAAQNNAVTAYIDSNYVEFGSPAKFSVAAKIKGGQKVELPPFNDNIVQDLEILKGPMVDTVYNTDLTLNLINSYLITSFKDSTFTIPQIPVMIDGKAYMTDSLSITFTLLQGIDSSFYEGIDTTQTLKIFDIREVKNTPWTFQEFWHRFGHIIIIVLISMLVAAAITYFVIRKIKNKPIIPIAKPKEPPHITAYRMLDKLRNSKLWQQGRVKDFYSVLTEILKSYITDRYNNSVIENTSEETLLELKRFMPSTDENFQNLKTLLDTADFVKFAKFEPLPNENDWALSIAYQFVDNTKLIHEITTQQQSNLIPEITTQPPLNDAAFVPPTFVGDASINNNTDNLN